MPTLPKPDPHAAHTCSSQHRVEIERSALCGCFYCKASFASVEIHDWTDAGATALCPRCGIDAVIGDASGYPITPEFLGAMKQVWF